MIFQTLLSNVESEMNTTSTLFYVFELHFKNL